MADLTYRTQATTYPETGGDPTVYPDQTFYLNGWTQGTAPGGIRVDLPPGTEDQAIAIPDCCFIQAISLQFNGTGGRYRFQYRFSTDDVLSGPTVQFSQAGSVISDITRPAGTLYVSTPVGNAANVPLLVQWVTRVAP